MTLLDNLEDLQWLKDVHKVDALQYRLAILHGNEDCPAKVELYAKDHYKCKPTVYEYNETNNELVLKTIGQNPDPRFLVGRPLTNTDTYQFLGAEFLAQDSEFENENGEPIEIDEQPYQPFDMVQPQPENES